MSDKKTRSIWMKNHPTSTKVPKQSRSILQVLQLVIPPRDCKHPIGTRHERGYYFFVPGIRELVLGVRE
jgi:hypothetical protein